jgi:hypothetical protein
MKACSCSWRAFARARSSFCYVFGFVEVEVRAKPKKKRNASVEKKKDANGILFPSQTSFSALAFSALEVKKICYMRRELKEGTRGGLEGAEKRDGEEQLTSKGKKKRDLLF